MVENIYDGVRIGEKLSLGFEFEEGKTTDYQLNVKGLDQITVLRAYGYALSEGELYKLPEEECNQLAGSEKRCWTDRGNTSSIISEDQIDHFMEKVVPGLMKLRASKYCGIHFQTNGGNTATSQAVFRPSEAPITC